MDFISGCIGGTAGCLCFYPLDTIKVRLQCRPKGTYKGVFDCFRQTVEREGARGLYRGLGPPLCTISITNSICFGTFGFVLRKCEEPTAIKSHFMAGVATGMVMSPIATPIELIKCKMQRQGISNEARVTSLQRLSLRIGASQWGKHPPHNFTGPIDCLRTIYKREGYWGLNRGLPATILRLAPGLGLYFSSFEYFKQTYQKHMNEECPFYFLFLAGGVSGCIPWAVFYPVDVIKSRIQCDGQYNPKRKRFSYKYSGYADCVRSSVRAEGYGLFYRGITSTFLRTFPNNGVILTVVTVLRTTFNRKEEFDSEITVVDISS